MNSEARIQSEQDPRVWTLRHSGHEAMIVGPQPLNEWVRVVEAEMVVEIIDHLREQVGFGRRCPTCRSAHALLAQLTKEKAP